MRLGFTSVLCTEEAEMYLDRDDMLFSLKWNVSCAHLPFITSGVIYLLLEVPSSVDQKLLRVSTLSAVG